MNIDIKDCIRKSREGDKKAERIQLFLINVISTYQSENPDSNLIDSEAFDVSLKINGLEMDVISFVNRVFDCHEENVKTQVKQEIISMLDEKEVELNNLFAQFKHQNGLIDDDEYYEQISHIY